MRKSLKFAAIALLTPGLVAGVGIAGAYASNSAKYEDRVTVVYNSQSDVLSVFDSKNDGLGGRAIYELSNGFASNLDNDRGFGTTTSRTIGGKGWIQFKACTKQGANTKKCSVPVKSAL